MKGRFTSSASTMVAATTGIAQSNPPPILRFPGRRPPVRRFRVYTGPSQTDAAFRGCPTKPSNAQPNRALLGRFARRSRTTTSRFPPRSVIHNHAALLGISFHSQKRGRDTTFRSRSEPHITVYPPKPSDSLRIIVDDARAPTSRNTTTEFPKPYNHTPFCTTSHDAKDTDSVHDDRIHAQLESATNLSLVYP